MSRFNNVNKVFDPAPKGFSRTGGAVAEPPPVAVKTTPLPVAGPSAPQPAPASLILPPKPSEINLGQTIGLWLLGAYLISAYANEFALRALGSKAYISTLAVATLPVALLASGNLFRCLKDTAGRLWVGFLIWMCLAIPFSVWKGGSVALLRDYVPHNWIIFVAAVAFTVSLKHLRWLMGVAILSNILLLLDCFVAARVSRGRLDLSHSIFFANANDLSLQLTLAITQFLYLFFLPQIWPRVLGALGIATALVYSLQTGSRGGALATVVLVGVIFLFGKYRVLTALFIVMAGIAALVVVPSEAFHRISLMTADDMPLSQNDLSATESRSERLVLLRQSLIYTVTHPVFGVGPGQFAVAVDGDAAKAGKRSAWLGTHNSYTQVSSECGIPALLCYAGVVFLCVLSNMRIYLRTKDNPRLRQANALAFSLMCGSAVFAVATFFYHIAYNGQLPVLGGMSVALRLAVDPILWGPRRAMPFKLTRPSFSPGQLAKGIA